MSEPTSKKAKIAKEINRQIVVLTEPITRLETSILSLSDKLAELAESDKKHSDFPYCVLVLPSSRIASETWELLNDIVSPKDIGTHYFETDTLDNLLFILNKYNIKLTKLMISRLKFVIFDGIKKDSIPTNIQKDSIYFAMIMEQLWHALRTKNNGLALFQKVDLVKKLNRSMLEDMLEDYIRAQY